MIDTTKPLELADGTPVTFIEMYRGDIYVRLPDCKQRLFNPSTGEHIFGEYPPLRNKKDIMTQFDPTKPVQTRDGRKARIICTDAKDAHYPIVALVADDREDDADESAIKYAADGRFLYSVSAQRPADLVNIPEPVVQFVNVYPEGRWGGYPAEFTANTHADHRARLALLKVTYTPGRGAEVEVVKEFPEGAA